MKIMYNSQYASYWGIKYMDMDSGFEWMCECGLPEVLPFSKPIQLNGLKQIEEVILIIVNHRIEQT